MDIAEYIRRRDKILIDLDVDEMIALMKEAGARSVPSNRDVALIALHKARAVVTSVPENLRLESKKWLTDRGFTYWDNEVNL